MIDHLTLQTPTGPLSLLARDATLVAAGFTANPEELAARLHPSLRGGPLRTVGDLGGLSAAVAAYFAGDIEALAALPVHQPASPTRERLWKALREVPAGQTVTYAELAAAAGVPRGARAAGAACAANLVAPVVPCHRVIRGDGGLGGYYYGVAVKEWLLAHERDAARTR